MTIKKDEFKRLVKDFNFKKLFNELGWDAFNKDKPIPVAINNEIYKLEPIAEKKGFAIFVCKPSNNNKIPDYNIRLKIDKKISAYHFEHLIIYVDNANKRQKWSLTIREQGKPLTVKEIDYYSHQEPELLYQKLKGLFFSLDEEDSITV
ncbi:hypothetical protein MCHI_001330, partial [Candidatus Magnetoovum chiemensis]